MAGLELYQAHMLRSDCAVVLVLQANETHAGCNVNELMVRIGAVGHGPDVEMIGSG